MKITIPAIVFFVLWISNAIFPRQENKVIQFDIGNVLNARPVTTLTHNKLVTWKKGIDGDGLADGYLTLSAALFNGDIDLHALPDNPVFSANSSHPEIKLHYSNTDSLHNQACGLIGAEEVEFQVPGNKYSAIYLALTSAEGPSTLRVQFSYADGIEVKNFTLPDYYWDLKPNDPDFCYLVHNLAKWGNKNNMTEKDHHNIDLLNIHPDPVRILKGIKISKNKPTYVVLWAAAGVRAN
jgi:hypothetical protein